MSLFFLILPDKSDDLEITLLLLSAEILKTLSHRKNF